MDISDLFSGRPAISTSEVANYLEIDESTARDFAAEEELDRLGSSFMWTPEDVAALADDLDDEDDADDADDDLDDADDNPDDDPDADDDGPDADDPGLDADEYDDD